MKIYTNTQVVINDKKWRLMQLGHDWEYRSASATTAKSWRNCQFWNEPLQEWIVSEGPPRLIGQLLRIGFLALACSLLSQNTKKTWSNINSRIPFAELQNCDLIWIWMDFSCDPFLEFFDASHLLFDRLWKFWHPWLFSIWSEPLHWRAQPSKLSQTATLSSASSLYGIPSCQR